jgi:hypothetical protein
VVCTSGQQINSPNRTPSIVIQPQIVRIFMTRYQSHFNRIMSPLYRIMYMYNFEVNSLLYFFLKRTYLHQLQWCHLKFRLTIKGQICEAWNSCWIILVFKGLIPASYETYSYCLQFIFIHVVATWNKGHPWNASFHFRFLILDSLDEGSISRKAAI